MQERRIERGLVELTLNSPDGIMKGRKDRVVTDKLQKYRGGAQ